MSFNSLFTTDSSINNGILSYVTLKDLNNIAEVNTSWCRFVVHVFRQANKDTYTYIWNMHEILIKNSLLSTASNFALTFITPPRTECKNLVQLQSLITKINAYVANLNADMPLFMPWGHLASQNHLKLLNISDRMDIDVGAPAPSEELESVVLPPLQCPINESILELYFNDLNHPKIKALLTTFVSETLIKNRNIHDAYLLLSKIPPQHINFLVQGIYQLVSGNYTLDALRLMAKIPLSCEHELIQCLSVVLHLHKEGSVVYFNSIEKEEGKMKYLQVEMGYYNFQLHEDYEPFLMHCIEVLRKHTNYQHFILMLVMMTGKCGEAALLKIVKDMLTKGDIQNASDFIDELSQGDTLDIFPYRRFIYHCACEVFNVSLDKKKFEIAFKYLTEFMGLSYKIPESCKSLLETVGGPEAVPMITEYAERASLPEIRSKLLSTLVDYYCQQDAGEYIRTFIYQNKFTEQDRWDNLLTYFKYQYNKNPLNLENELLTSKYYKRNLKYFEGCCRHVTSQLIQGQSGEAAITFLKKLEEGTQIKVFKHVFYELKSTATRQSCEELIRSFLTMSPRDKQYYLTHLDNHILD